MSFIANLPYLNDKINNVILEERAMANLIWSIQDIDDKYKNEWINSNVKMKCCYNLVIEWFNSENEIMYAYDEQLCEILEACKKEYFAIHRTRNFPVNLYQPKQLLKFYIYQKCEILSAI
jgi:hypothetical protein